MRMERRKKAFKARMHLAVLDADDVRAQLATSPYERPGEPYLLPQDTERLNRTAAAAGMSAVFVDFPELFDPDTVHACAARLCDASLTLPNVTNDVGRYRALFIPAYMLGYGIGLLEIETQTSIQRAQVQEMTLALPGDLRIALHYHLLCSHLEKVGAKTIYDLYPGFSSKNNLGK